MIYADSGIIMRWVEGAEQVRAPIDVRWRQVASSERLFVTSRLSRLECRCKPLREKQDKLVRLYDTFFASEEVILEEIDATVIETATEVRATTRLKTPDAIHVATAILVGAAAFWTTDASLSKCTDLTVEVFRAI